MIDELRRRLVRGGDLSAASFLGTGDLDTLQEALKYGDCASPEAKEVPSVTRGKAWMGAKAAQATQTNERAYIVEPWNPDRHRPCRMNELEQQ